MKQEPFNGPVPAEEIMHGYLELINDLERAVKEITTARFDKKLQCRAGCSSCCVEFSVLPLEAAIIRKHINISVNVKQKQSGEPNVCGLLTDGLCSLYEVRPVICRTQGLPLGYVDELEGTIEVSACHLNFPEDAVIEFEDIFLMDDYNSRLAVLNIEYCNNNNLDPEQRICLKSLLAGLSD